MQIKLSDRAREAQLRMKELTQEMHDYNAIVMCIQALQSVEGKPEKFDYSQEEYDKVVEKLRKLCAKHEIPLPDTSGYFQWSSIELT